MSEQEMRLKLARDILDGRADMQTDNSGQVIVYGQVFRHTDGTVHPFPDPNWIDNS